MINSKTEYHVYVFNYSSPQNKQAKFLIILLLDALIFFQPLHLGRHKGASWL